jgi:hypothetical protein
MGGWFCAIRRRAAESPAAFAAVRAAIRLVEYSSSSPGTSRFQRTLAGMLSAAARVGWICALSAARAG